MGNRLNKLNNIKYLATGALVILLCCIFALPSVAAQPEAILVPAVTGQKASYTLYPHDSYGNQLRFSYAIYQTLTEMVMVKPDGTEIHTDTAYDDKKGGIICTVSSTKSGKVRMYYDVMVEGNRMAHFIEFDFKDPVKTICILPVGSAVAVADGQVVKLGENTVIKEGRAWVSAAEIAKMLGYEVKRFTAENNDEGLVFLSKGTSITLVHGKSEIEVVKSDMRTKVTSVGEVQIHKGMATVPVKTLCELLGLEATTGMNDKGTALEWVKLTKTGVLP